MHSHPSNLGSITSSQNCTEAPEKVSCYTKASPDPCMAKLSHGTVFVSNFMNEVSVYQLYQLQQCAICPFHTVIQPHITPYPIVNSRVQCILTSSSAVAERLCELGDFKEGGHFQAKF